jgi:hypothetical protein
MLPPFLRTHTLILAPLRSTPIQGCIYHLPTSEDPLQRAWRCSAPIEPSLPNLPSHLPRKVRITRCTTGAPPHAKSRLAYPLDCVADYLICICIPHNVIVTRLIIHSSVQCSSVVFDFSTPLIIPRLEIPPLIFQYSCSFQLKFGTLTSFSSDLCLAQPPS